MTGAVTAFLSGFASIAVPTSLACLGVTLLALIG